MRFSDRGAMVWGAREVRICKCNSSEWCGAQNGTWWQGSVLAEKESWLWAHVCMSPAVQNDPSDVSARVNSRSREHISQLSSYLQFVIAKWRRTDLSAPPISLLLH